MKIRLAIVENDFEVRQDLINLLGFYQIFEVIGEFDDVNHANDFILTNEVDVVFINMGVGNPEFSGDGSYLAYNLTSHKPDLIAVMFASEEHSASKIFQMQCSEFFTLPFDALSMQRVVNRVKNLYELLQYKNHSLNRSIMIKTNKGYQLVTLSDILFIERASRKNRVVTTEGKEIILSGYSLDELENLLASNNFYRCYQSFIVNLSKVSFIRVNNETKNYALLFNEYAGEVTLSRDKYNEVVRMLKEKFARISL